MSINKSKGAYSRRIDENIFCSSQWSPKKAYLLGQFKAGANFQKKDNQFTFSNTDLQHLIKLQVLMNSNHRIHYDYKIKSRYKEGSARFIFAVTNKYLRDQLKQYGFVGTSKQSAKYAAPFPADTPHELVKHYLRGFIDDRGSVYTEKRFNKPVLRVTYNSESFLELLSLIMKRDLAIKARNISGDRLKKTKSIKWNGQDQVQKIFKYLYSDIPEGLYCIKKYERFCEETNYGTTSGSARLNLNPVLLEVVPIFTRERYVLIVKPRCGGWCSIGAF